MATVAIRPTGVEREFRSGELIVSKTDLKGKITYCNQVFCRISGYTERELLGQPHNIIRHPDMPRGAFKLLWDRVEAGHEIFAAVVNLAKTGEHYWVLAHVTPTYDGSGQMTGYHSSRRVLPDLVRKTLVPIYNKMLSIEKGETNTRKAAALSLDFLTDHLRQAGMSYDQFIFSLLKEA